MSVEWQSRDFLTDWTGLFRRRQTVDLPPSFARTARNVDFFGSAIGKRAGTKLVNGAVTTATAAWTNAPNATGPVADASSFRAGDQVFWMNPATQTLLGSGAIASIAGSTVTMTAPMANLPQIGSALIVRHDLGFPITGMFHAVFRDGTEQLLAAAGSAIWNIWGSQVGGGFAPVKLSESFAGTTIPTTWSTTTQGTFTSYETLVAADHTMHTLSGPTPTISAAEPDIIRITHAGTVIYEGTIATLNPPGAGVTLTAPASQVPQAGDTVTFFPHRQPGDTHFCILNNRVYVTSGAAANSVKSGAGIQANQRQPPVVIEQPAPTGSPPVTGPPYIRRMGVRAPSSMALGNPPAAPPTNPFNGNYGWRYTYVNGLNGQESEPSPIPVPSLSSFINQDAVIQLNPSPDPQVTKIRLYRTLANQDGTWYFVDELPNAQQNYQDKTPDAGLGELLKTFTNEPPPNTMSYMTVWPQAGTLMGIDSGSIAEGGENVAWADAPDIVNGVYKLESWPLNNTLFVTRDDGDHLCCLGAFYDSVLVWKTRSLQRIVGTPPDLILQPISFVADQTGVGILSTKGFVMEPDVAVFASEDGFYQVSRYEGVQQGFTSTRISRAIDQEWLNRAVGMSATPQGKAACHLVYNRLVRQLQAFVATDGASTPNEDFLYQFEGTVEGTPHGWSEWSVPHDYTAAGGSSASVTSSCAVRNIQTSLESIYLALGPFGLVVQQGVGAGDWQVFPVSFDYDTVWFSPGGAGTIARGRSLDCVFTPTAGTPALVLQIATDFTPTPDRYALPALTNLGVEVPVRPLFLALGEYWSLGLQENSANGLFLVEDFTFWFQRLPVGVTPRIVVEAI